MDETQTNKKRKKKKGSCYQCGQFDHRAKDCPNITTNASSYLQFAKREAPPDSLLPPLPLILMDLHLLNYLRG